MASPRQAGATKQQEEAKAASGCRVGVCQTTFGDAALKLLDNGYEPLPLVAGRKAPAVFGWPKIPLGESAIEQWARRFPRHGIGLRTGTLVGVDIDISIPISRTGLTGWFVTGLAKP